MPEEVLSVAVGKTPITEAGFDQLVVDLVVSPSTLAHRLGDLELMEDDLRDHLATGTARGSLTHLGQLSAWTNWVDQASRPRLPLRLVGDLWTAFEDGETTLRPLANLLGRGVEELRAELDWPGPAPEAYASAS